MNYKPEIQVVLKRLKAFWKKDIYDRPPIQIRFPIEGESSEIWTQACQKAETHFAYWDNIMQERAKLADDSIPSATLDLGPAFMPAVMGCPIHFGNGTSWSDHILKEWADLKGLQSWPLDDNNQWIYEMKKRVAYFTEQSKGKCAVGVAMLTGPGDIMTALRGPAEICTDFYLYPNEVKELAEICTRAWITVNSIQLDLIPPLEGGYCDNYSYWTPGRTSYFADDISNLISPETYMEHLYRFDAVIAASNDNPWMHVHSGGARLVPEFRKIPGLKGIQIVNDRPAGPKLKEILPYIKMVQEKHCLILRKYPMEELLDILPELSPKGLYIDTFCGSLEEAQEILEDWNSRF